MPSHIDLNGTDLSITRCQPPKSVCTYVGELMFECWDVIEAYN
jgi:hypothetical protein